jgi:predicted GTPase
MDLIDKDNKTFEEFKERLLYSFYRAADFPIISISAKDKQRIHKLMTTAIELADKAAKRIETGKLNRAFEEIEKTGRLRGSEPNTRFTMRPRSTRFLHSSSFS